MNKFKDNKQFFFDEEDDFLVLRREAYKFTKDFLNTCRPGTKLLEIGPDNDENMDNNTSLLIKNHCKDNNITYKTCNIIDGYDYKCDIAYMSSIINTKFDYIIANSVLEHVELFYLVPLEVWKTLEINGKVLFISPDGYKSLFGGYFKCNIESYPENQIEKNSFPLLINFIGSKNE